MGDIPELGKWSNLICPLTWTEGNNWTTCFHLPANITEFNYKVVIYNESTKVKKWEDGPNRTYSISTSNLENEDICLKWNELA